MSMLEPIESPNDSAIVSGVALVSVSSERPKGQKRLAKRCTSQHYYPTKYYKNRTKKRDALGASYFLTDEPTIRIITEN